MANETIYTQSQVDGNIRALTTTMAELRERTAERDRLAEAVRMMRETEALLRGQVEARLEYNTSSPTPAQLSAQVGAALALVRDTFAWINDMAIQGAKQLEGADLDALEARARALLGKENGKR